MEYNGSDDPEAEFSHTQYINDYPITTDTAQEAYDRFWLERGKYSA